MILHHADKSIYLQFVLMTFIGLVGGQRGHVPQFSTIFCRCASRDGVPNQILLLAWSQNIWPHPNVSAGCAIDDIKANHAKRKHGDGAKSA